MTTRTEIMDTLAGLLGNLTHDGQPVPLDRDRARPVDRATTSQRETLPRIVLSAEGEQNTPPDNAPRRARLAHWSLRAEVAIVATTAETAGAIYDSVVDALAAPALDDLLEDAPSVEADFGLEREGRQVAVVVATVTMPYLRG